MTREEATAALLELFAKHEVAGKTSQMALLIADLTDLLAGPAIDTWPETYEGPTHTFYSNGAAKPNNTNGFMRLNIKPRDGES